MDAEARREVFSGLASDGRGSGPPHLCLPADEPVSGFAGIDFDVDSITGFPATSLWPKKVFVGIRPKCQCLTSSLASISAPVPCLTLTRAGRYTRFVAPCIELLTTTLDVLLGLKIFSLYLLFPHLYREAQQTSRLRDQDFRLWMNGLLLPIIHEHYSSSHVQHYPSSYDSSR